MDDQFREFTDVPTPTLSFGAPVEEKPEPVAVKEEPVQPQLDESMLSDEERRLVDEFSKQIDIHNTNGILQYGVGTQKKMADFSETALKNVKTKDLGEVGDMISGLVTELKSFDVEEEKGFLGFFKKSGNKMTALKAKYDKAEVNVEKITGTSDMKKICDLKGRPLLLWVNSWSIGMTLDRNKGLKLAEFGRA